MADNTELNTGSGGDTIATDDIDGVKHQRVKVEFGTDGSATDVQAAAPLPVEISDGVDTANVTAAGALEVAGDVTNAGTFAVQADSVIPGTGATNLGKAEDAAHTSGDTGVMSLAVRADDPTAALAADGDYVPLTISAEGGLWTEGLPSNINTGNSTTSTLGSGATFTGTGAEMLDHHAVTVILDASHDSASEGMQFQFSSDNTNWDYSIDFTYTTANGGRIFQFGAYAQYFRIVYTNGGTGQTHFRVQTLLHHQTTLTTIHRLVDDVSPDRSAEVSKSIVIAQAAGTGNFVPVQATASGNFKMSIEEVDGAIAGGGDESSAMRVTLANDSTGLLSVDDNGGSLTVDNGGTFPVQVDAALPTGSNNIGEIDVIGDVAHDAADSGNPIKVGAVADSTEQAAVADGDRTNLLATLNGKLVTHPYAVPERYTSGVTAAITDTSNTSVIANPGAGLRLYITHILVTNSHATVGTVVEIKSSTTVLYRGYAKEAGGGFSITLPVPLKFTANNTFNVACITTGSNVYVSATGYIAP